VCGDYDKRRNERSQRTNQSGRNVMAGTLGRLGLRLRLCGGFLANRIRLG
jgi:hypothetical protein